MPATGPALPSRLPASASLSATKPCSAGLNTPRNKSATGVWRRRPAIPSPPRLPGHTAARSLSPCSKRKVWMWCSATQKKGASTERPSSTTARAACSTALVWAGSFPPMPCRSISPAVCRHSAHTVHYRRGRAAARHPSRRGIRRGVFLRLGLARRRRFGRTGRGSRLRARSQAQAKETPQGAGIIIQSFT